MVGALSIIRFRHPVKSPLELSIYFLLLTVGITIFGGMLFSTFFTLYVIPTVYTIIGKGTQRIDAVEIELKKQLKK